MKMSGFSPLAVPPGPAPTALEGLARGRRASHRPPMAPQSELFEDERDDNDIFINERCRIQTSGGYRVVTACGIAIAHYVVGDRMSEAHAMVMLVDQGLAQQVQVARAFNCDERTVCARRGPAVRRCCQTCWPARTARRCRPPDRRR